jgi:WD40 repeat protein
MRLLELSSNDELIFTKDFVDNVPAYAILSHTWGQEDHEVTFKDIRKKRGHGKPGYQKIVFCGKQAWDDGLRYFWVDTCCIDKSNSTELAEAINSMYKWYHNSARCYVYLGDVEGNNLAVSTCMQSFRESRWFQRGWTLQELIAPKTVHFFSAGEKCIGNKEGLMQDIHEITGIPIRGLQGQSLSEFGVDERMSWAKDRNTTRPEDRAYSLLGIVGVFLPLLYGEGEMEAFGRLRREIHTRQNFTAGDSSANRTVQYVQSGQKTIVNRRNVGNVQKPGVRRWGTELRTLEGHQGGVAAIAFSHDGNILASASGETVQHWLIPSGIVLRTLQGHQDEVWAIAFSSDGKFLASGSIDSTIRLWDSQSGTALRTLQDHQDEVWAIAFSPDGKFLASGSIDSTIRLWDSQSGTALQTLLGHQNAVGAIAFSPDGKFLASGSDDSTIRLWDSQSGTALRTLQDHQDEVGAIAFSPDGKFLASGSFDSTIRLWDSQSGTALQTLLGHQNAVGAIAFSPDGEILASGSNDKTIRLWDSQSGTALQTLLGHQGAVEAIAFSPDGEILASGSDDKTIRLWTIRH